MKADDYRGMTDEEMREKLEDLRESLYRLRHRRAVEEDVGTGQIGEARKDIARVLTVLRERELERVIEGSAHE